MAMTSQEATLSSAEVISSDTPFISGQVRSPKLESLPNVFYTVPKFTDQMQVSQIFNYLLYNHFVIAS